MPAEVLPVAAGCCFRLLPRLLPVVVVVAVVVAVVVVTAQLFDHLTPRWIQFGIVSFGASTGCGTGHPNG